jgi:CubicO group peptidase (beta-lactamase class C family)
LTGAVREADGMTRLVDALRPLVDSRLVPGLVAAVGRGRDVEVVVLGDRSIDGGPMGDDALFRIASVTKPMMAALTLTFVADGTFGLDEPVGGLLAELASPLVVRSMNGSPDDTVPASGPITVRHLLTSTNGHGFPSDFSAPVAQLLVERLGQGPPQPQRVRPPDEWMAVLGGIPLLHQPGDAFTYNTAFDILGVLVARAAGRSLPELMAQRIFEPLAMTETGFAFPPETNERRTSYYRDDDRGLIEQDSPDGQWSSVPAFASGAGGLVSTVTDVLAFARMLLDGGGDLLPAALVAAMTADQLTPNIRATDTVFLDGQSWGFGGAVDIERRNPWNVPGRFGWVGGTGTSAYIVPTDDSVAILLTQVELTGPTGSRVIEGFWSAAAEHLGHDRI